MWGFCTPWPASPPIAFIFIGAGRLLRYMQIMSIAFGFPTKFTEYNPMHQKIVQFFRTCSCIGSAM